IGARIVSVYSDSSAVPIWIQRPSISDDKSAVSFAGIIPGGFRGKGTLFGFTFVVDSGWVARVIPSDIVAYQGADAPVPVRVIAGPEWLSAAATSSSAAMLND